MAEMSVPVAGAGAAGQPDRRRWLILAVIGLAQLMVVLDVTIMNIALPSAQHALHFTNVDRQWVVTAYSLAFGSLLLLGGRLADLIGRKVTFMAGLAGFAVASAVGGAAVSFAMLVTARACQGAFGALLAPAALSLLTTTFSDPKERGKAFGVYGAIAGAGGAVGLLLGGVLTEYLSWRWCLYVNLFFAGVAIAGGALLLTQQPSAAGRPAGHPRRAAGLRRRVLPGLRVLERRARTAGHAPSTYGFLAAGGAAARRVRGLAGPGQPPAAAAAGRPRPQPGRRLPGASLIVGAGMFGVFLFLTYYLQQTLGLLAGRHRRGLPADGRLHRGRREPVQHRAAAPDRPQAAGRARACCCGGRAGLAHPDRAARRDYAADVLRPAACSPAAAWASCSPPAMNTGTYGVAPQDAGVASAIGQHRPAGRRLDRHLAAEHDRGQRDRQLRGRAQGRLPRPGPGASGGGHRAWLHDGVLVVRRVFLSAAIICGALMRPGALYSRQDAPAEQAEVPAMAAAAGEATTAAAEAAAVPED